MSYDAVQSGPPTSGPWPAGAHTVTSAIDTNTLAEWINDGTHGWAPVSSAAWKQVQSALAAEPASYAVTVPVTGLYQVTAYLISTVATSGTMPAISAAYTDADTGGSATETVVTSTTTSAANTVKSGTVAVNVKAGGTITLTGASYATTTYNVKYRISYIG